jgi:hypothetical protein
MNAHLFRAATLAAMSVPFSVAVEAGSMTQPTSVEGVEATVLEAKRGDGDTVIVKWQLENKTKEKKKMSSQSTGWYDVYRLTGDAYFLDNAGRTKYTVVKTPDRVPIAAKYGAPNTWPVIAPSAKVTLWAKFNAPPPGVQKIEVYLPTVSLPFESVELK